MIRKSKFTVKPSTASIFILEEFHIQVFLVSETNDLLKVNHPLQISLKYESGEKISIEPSIFSTNPSSVQLSDGVAQFEMVVYPTANSHLIGNKILVHVAAEFNDFTVEGLSSACVLCKAFLTFVKQPPEKWYKDEGGKNNCFELAVKLEDRGHVDLRNNTPVPLDVVLLYEDLTEVKQQSILQTASDNQMVADPNSDCITLRFRVDEVSMNHQKQRFRIKILPNALASPAMATIAPAITNPFTVLSKRKKRKTGGKQKKESTSSASEHSDHESEPEQKPAKRVQFHLGGEAAVALDGVLKWTQSMLDMVQRLEWEQVGCEFDPSGHPDPSRPIYRCPSCRKYREYSMPAISARHSQNCELQRNLLEYSSKTMFHFHMLAEKIQTACTPVEQWPPSHPPDPGMSDYGSYESPGSLNERSGPYSQQPQPICDQGMADYGSYESPGSLCERLGPYPQPMQPSCAMNGTSSSRYSLDPEAMPFGSSIATNVFVPDVPDVYGQRESKVSMIIYEDIQGHGVPAFDEKGEPLGFYQMEYKSDGTVLVFKEFFVDECSPELLMMLDDLKIKTNRSGPDKKEQAVYQLKNYQSLEEMKSICFRQAPTFSTEEVFNSVTL